MKEKISKSEIEILKVDIKKIEEHLRKKEMIEGWRGQIIAGMNRVERRLEQALTKIYIQEKCTNFNVITVILSIFFTHLYLFFQIFNSMVQSLLW